MFVEAAQVKQMKWSNIDELLKANAKKRKKIVAGKTHLKLAQ
jgi:hypothetical protein